MGEFFLPSAQITSQTTIKPDALTVSYDTEKAFFSLIEKRSHRQDVPIIICSPKRTYQELPCTISNNVQAAAELNTPPHSLVDDIENPGPLSVATLTTETPSIATGINRSPTENGSEIQGGDRELDAATGGGGSIADPEVELEADAESLLSSEESDALEDDVIELQYFRFARTGLSIFVDISKKDSAQDEFLEQQHQLPKLIDFEECCYKKYPSNHPIGYLVDRYCNRVNVETDRNLTGSSASQQTATFPNNTLPLSTAPGSTNLVPDAGSIGSGGFSEIIKDEKKTVTSSLPLTDAPPKQQDRLSSVINDILHRLNRQGVLADPRDVCRKGGGRSGDYYEKDDTFFDDELVYEHLGVSPNTSVLRQTHSRHPRFSKRIGKTVTGPSGGPSEESTTEDEIDEDDIEDEDDEEEDLCIYDYHDVSIFAFDNDSTKDDEELLIEDEEVVESGYEDNKHMLAASELREGPNNKDALKYVTTKHWLRPKAWRSLEPRLTKEVVDVFKKLEDDLKGKGDKRGLLLDPKQVLCTFREALETIFTLAYPSVTWNVSETINTYATMTEHFLEQQQYRPKKKRHTNVISVIPDQTSIVTSLHDNASGERHCIHPSFDLHPVDETTTSATILMNDTFRVDEHQHTDVTRVLQNPTRSSLILLPNKLSDDCLSPAEMHHDTKSITHELTAPDIEEVEIFELPSQNAISLSSKGLNNDDDLSSLLFEPKHKVNASEGCEHDQSRHSFARPESHTLSVAFDLGSLVDSASNSIVRSGAAVSQQKKVSRRKNTAASTSSNPAISSHAAPLASVDDINWSHLALVTSCMIKMSSVMQPQVMKRLWTTRVVLHNQVIYSSLEFMICHAVVKKSPLFRTKGALFFRNLKKAVDAFLSKLSNPNNTSSSSTSIRDTPTAPPQSTAPCYESQNTRTPTELPLSAPTGELASHASPQTATAENDSPFAPVATDLLNWAIIYNCRRNELREIGESFDEWSAPFGTYVSSLLNNCIEKRKRKNISMTSGGKANNEIPTQQVALTASQKKNRIWIPARFMDETLEKFRQDYNVVTLYEKRSRKPGVPVFVQPCKSIFPVISTRSKKAASNVIPQQQLNPHRNSSPPGSTSTTKLKVSIGSFSNINTSADNQTTELAVIATGKVCTTSNDNVSSPTQQNNNATKDGTLPSYIVEKSLSLDNTKNNKLTVKGLHNADEDSSNMHSATIRSPSSSTEGLAAQHPHAIIELVYPAETKQRKRKPVASANDLKDLSTTQPFSFSSPSPSSSSVVALSTPLEDSDYQQSCTITADRKKTKCDSTTTRNNKKPRILLSADSNATRPISSFFFPLHPSVTAKNVGAIANHSNQQPSPSLIMPTNDESNFDSNNSTVIGTVNNVSANDNQNTAKQQYLIEISASKKLELSPEEKNNQKSLALLSSTPLPPPPLPKDSHHFNSELSLVSSNKVEETYENHDATAQTYQPHLSSSLRQQIKRQNYYAPSDSNHKISCTSTSQTESVNNNVLSQLVHRNSSFFQSSAASCSSPTEYGTTLALDSRKTTPALPPSCESSLNLSYVSQNDSSHFLIPSSVQQHTPTFSVSSSSSSSSSSKCAGPLSLQAPILLTSPISKRQISPNSHSSGAEGHIEVVISNQSSPSTTNSGGYSSPAVIGASTSFETNNPSQPISSEINSSRSNSTCTYQWSPSFNTMGHLLSRTNHINLATTGTPIGLDVSAAAAIRFLPAATSLGTPEIPPALNAFLFSQQQQRWK